MIGTVPFGGISKTGNATVQAVTTAAAQLNFQSATNTPNTGSRVGDPAVKPDAANNRIQINEPGIYEIDFDASGTAASALQCTFQLRKGVSSMAAISGTKCANTFNTAPTNVGMTRLVEVTASDLPSTGGAATFADPDATAGAGKPGGGFAGAGAAPKTGIYIDVQVTGDGSVNLTLTDMALSVKRLG